MTLTDRQQPPFLIVDITRCKRNIEKMVNRAADAETIFRPHFKTHQSRTIGRWFRNYGVTGITVSSVSMAQYFADDGWSDITIAFPFYNQQIPALRNIEKQSDLRLFINSTNDLTRLESELKNPFKFYIEIDPDYGRSGISYINYELIQEIIQQAQKLQKPQFHGFYIHDGRTYSARGKNEIRDRINPTIDILRNLKKMFPNAVISLGDTPSASKSDRIHEVDEMTPGNFVFYDFMQVNIGSCSLDEVALFAVLPVGQIIPQKNRSILHGGAVHLSKEFIESKKQHNFGQVINYSEDKEITKIEGLFLTALSQEHGTLNGLPVHLDNHVWVCPIHSCLTANLHSRYYTTAGEVIDKRILS